MKLVSIIVPVYKTEQFLDKCIKSLVDQTYKDIEIILVDDGSPDKCPEICDSWAEKDNRIKVIHKENGGVTSAWTKGVEESNGEFITFVDSDDCVKEDYIESLINPYLKDPATDLVICNYMKFNETKEHYNTELQYFKSTILEGKELEDYKKYNSNYLPDYKGTKLYKRETILNNIKYADKRVSYGDDRCIVRSAILDAKKIYIVDKPLYAYYIRTQSISHSYNAKLLNNFEILQDDFEHMLTSKKYDTPFNKVALALDSIYSILINLFSSKTKNKKKIFKEVLNSKLGKIVLDSNKNIFKGNCTKFYSIIKSRSYFLCKLYFLHLSLKRKLKKEL